MSITPLNIGSAPNDGNGQDLRSGGQLINANFAELDTRTTTAQAKADAAIPSSQKGAPGGVAGLDGGGKVPAGQLPNTDAVTEGATNLYFTGTRARNIGLAGLSLLTGGAITSTDTLLVALGRLQNQITTASNGFASAVRGTLLDGLSLASAAAVVASDNLLAAVGKLQAQVSARLPLAGGALTGAITSSNDAQFVRLTLTTTADTMISGGESHAAVGLGAALSLARNTNMVSEFIVASDNAGFAPRFNLLKSAGTVAAPVALANTNLIGAFQFVAYNGTGYAHSASMVSPVDGAPGAGFVPGCIQFNTVNAVGVSAARWQFRASGNFEPCVDNAYSLGSISARATTVFAATGAINTSDAREKTPVSTLTDNEVAAAKALGKEIGTYQWLEAIQEKGEGARHHVGMTVQRAIEVMTANGLDAMAYGFICYDTWDSREVAHQAVVEQVPAQNEEGETIYTEVVKQEAWTETLPAGDRFSFRYDELNLFIAAGFEARLAILEEKAAN